MKAGFFSNLLLYCSSMKRAKQIGIENVGVVSVSSSGRKTGGQDQAVEQDIALHNKTLHSK